MRKSQERLRFLVTWRGLLFGRGELETEVEGPLAEKGRQEYKSSVFFSQSSWGPFVFFLGPLKLGPQDIAYRKNTKLFTNLHYITMKALSKMLFATVDGGFLLGFSVGSRNIGVLHISHSFVCEWQLDILRGKPRGLISKPHLSWVASFLSMGSFCLFPTLWAS